MAAEAALGEEDRYPVVVIDDANHGQADMSAMFDGIWNAVPEFSHLQALFLLEIKLLISKDFI